MPMEIRRVPADWVHPKNEDGYIPMFAEYYADAVDEWYKEHQLWLKGIHPNQIDTPIATKEYRFFAEWAHDSPPVALYNPNKWTAENARCFQVYEITTEGTPISPVLQDFDSLMTWLQENGLHELCGVIDISLYPDKMCFKL